MAHSFYACNCRKVVFRAFVDFVLKLWCFAVEDWESSLGKRIRPAVAVHFPVWRCGAKGTFRTVAPIREIFFRGCVTSDRIDACQLQARQGCTPQLIES